MIVRLLVLSAACLCCTPPAVLSQQASPPSHLTTGVEAVRFHLGVQPVHDLLGPRGWTSTDPALSGRITLTAHLDPRLAVYGGAMRLAPSGFDLRGGFAGTRYILGAGQFRAGPFLEGGHAELRASRGPGEQWETGAGRSGETPLPAYRATTVFGAGTGVESEYALTSAVTARLTLGYFHYAQSAFGIRHLYAGLGLSWGWRDEPWYWRRTGADLGRPSVVILNEASESIDALRLEMDTLRITASAPAGIRTVEVDGQRVSFARLEADSLGAVESSTVRASVHVPVPPGETKATRIAAVDRMGTRTEIETRLLGPPHDRDPPVIVLAGNPIEVRRTPSRITGYVTDQSPLDIVRVGGQDADLREVGADSLTAELSLAAEIRHHRFSALLELEPGENRFEVMAIDTAGHEASVEQIVILLPASTPLLEVFHPAAAAEVSSDRVNVIGRVTHWAPIELVTVGAEPARLREIATEAPAEHGAHVFIFESVAHLAHGQNHLTVLARDAEGFQAVAEIMVMRGDAEAGRGDTP